MKGEKEPTGKTKKVIKNLKATNRSLVDMLKEVDRNLKTARSRQVHLVGGHMAWKIVHIS